MSDETADAETDEEAETPAAQVHRDAYDQIEALNWSRLNLLSRSPSHYRLGFGDDSSAFALGTAAHMAVLESARFLEHYVVYPGKQRRGKAWEAFESDAIRAGKEVLSRSEYDKATGIRGAVSAHAKASQHLSKGKPEETLTWTITAGDLVFNCKGRADYIGAAIVDLKSTQCAAPVEFGRSCVKYNYLGQAAWYSDGYFLATGIRKPFVFIAVESADPHMVGVYNVTDEQLEQGRELYLSLLGKLDYCTKHNWWSGYTESSESDLLLPSWQRTEAA